MASAFSNILKLLSLGSGRIKENEDFGLEVTEDGIETTGDRYKQSGLGRFINRVGGDKTADDMNRAFENALMKAEMDMKIQQMQSQAQTQAAQDLANLNNSLVGQRELEAFIRNRGAAVEDRDLANQRLKESELRKFTLGQKEADADLDRLPFKHAAEKGLTREEANDPAYRHMLRQLGMSEMDFANIKNVSGVRNQASLNRQGDRDVNIRGMSGPIPLGAVMGMGQGALNLFQDPEDPAKQALGLQLLQAQIDKYRSDVEAAAQTRRMFGGGSDPINGIGSGKSFKFNGDDLTVLDERE